MILDNEAELVTATAFDLGPKKPGPGNPIKLWITGVGASVVFTTGATSAAADALMTVDATAGPIEVELPSNTLQFIKATFASGAINVTLPGNQTNT